MRRYLNFDSVMITTIVGLLLFIFVIKLEPLLEEVAARHLENGIVLEGLDVMEIVGTGGINSDLAFHFIHDDSDEITIINDTNIIELIYPDRDYRVKLNRDTDGEDSSFTITPE